MQTVDIEFRPPSTHQISFSFSLPLTNIMHEQDSRLIRTTNQNGAASLIKIIIKTALKVANRAYN